MNGRRNGAVRAPLGPRARGIVADVNDEGIKLQNEDTFRNLAYRVPAGWPAVDLSSVNVGDEVELQLNGRGYVIACRTIIQQATTGGPWDAPPPPEPTVPEQTGVPSATERRSRDVLIVRQVAIKAASSLVKGQDGADLGALFNTAERIESWIWRG